jgi:7,8-dihydroneopterin aldolase/epimerase/oxygenase
MDRIFVEGMTFRGRCGVTKLQRRMKRKILVDLEIETSCARAGKSDDLRDTVDYAELYAIAKRTMQKKVVRLLERWAEDIAGEVLQRYAVGEVRVRVRKPGVPAKGVVSGVEIVRRNT